MSVFGSSTNEFVVVDESAGIFSLTRSYETGWGLRSTAVRLDDDGSLAVYSPSKGLGDPIHEQLASVGNVRFLVAPNCYHYLGMSEWLERYPDAKAVATDLAAKRIQGRTGLELAPVAELQNSLPGGMQLFEPEGLKNGELWLGIRSNDGRYLIIGDAFTSLPGPFRGRAGLALRATGVGPGPRVPRTWRWLHQRSAKTYESWRATTLEQWGPTTLIPCHGEILTEFAGTARR